MALYLASWWRKCGGIRSFSLFTIPQNHQWGSKFFLHDYITSLGFFTAIDFFFVWFIFWNGTKFFLSVENNSIPDCSSCFNILRERFSLFRQLVILGCFVQELSFPYQTLPLSNVLKNYTSNSGLIETYKSLSPIS